MLEKITNVCLCLAAITATIFLIICVICFGYSMYKVLLVV